MLCLLFAECKRNIKIKGKSCICFVDLEKAFDRVLRKVTEWAMRKKKVPEVMMNAIMSQYNGAKKKVKVGSGLSDELSVNVGVRQLSALSLLLFMTAVDAVTERVRNGSINKILYADDLIWRDHERFKGQI